MQEAWTASTHVLVVDDEALVGLLVADLLRAEDLEVSLAHGGAEALAMARAQKPDLVVMGWKMPGLCGAELLQALRLARPGLSVVVFSGYDLTSESLVGPGDGPEPVSLRKAADLDLLAPTVLGIAATRRLRRQSGNEAADGPGFLAACADLSLLAPLPSKAA